MSHDKTAPPPSKSAGCPTPSAALLRQKGACSYIGNGRPKLHELHENDPTFPRKIRLGSRSVGWRREDLDRWLEQKAQANQVTSEG